MRRHKHKGFSLVELSITTLMLAAIFGMAILMTMQTSRIAKKVETTSIGTVRARQTLDMFVQDVQRADRVLSAYPINAPTFESNNSDTIILRQPTLDAQAKVLPGVYDVVVYQWENAEAKAANIESAAAHKLYRYAAKIENGTQSAVGNARTLLDNARMFSLEYAVAQSFSGDGNRKEFGLAVAPRSASDPLNRIALGGIDAISTGAGGFQGGKVKFDMPPKNKVPLDVYFPVNPAAGADAEGGTAANYVTVRLKFGSVWKTVRQQDRTRTLEISTKALLRNHD